MLGPQERAARQDARAAELAEARLQAVEAIWVEACEALERQINRATNEIRVGTPRGLELCPRSALIYLERSLRHALDREAP